MINTIVLSNCNHHLWRTTSKMKTEWNLKKTQNKRRSYLGLYFSFENQIFHKECFLHFQGKGVMALVKLGSQSLQNGAIQIFIWNWETFFMICISWMSKSEAMYTLFLMTIDYLSWNNFFPWLVLHLITDPITHIIEYVIR